MTQRWIAAMLLLGSLTAQGCGQSAVGPPAPAQSAASFESGGRRISIERFEPEGRAKGAAVILLHGAYGPDRDGEFLRPLGRQLSSRGYLVLLPHYFDRTSTMVEELVDKDGVTPGGAALMARHESAWDATVGDAISDATSQPGLGSARIGLLGFSLGASLACSRAAHDPRVKVVVDYGGGLPFADPGKVGSTPPTLIFQGESDRLVPAKYSAQFEGLLKSGGIPCELVTYPGEGHYFGAQASRDAEGRAIEFLARHLDPERQHTNQRP